MWRSRAILSCVSVPVLSVQSTSIAPKFWIASRRLTTTFLRDSSTAPLASVEVTIIGSISGVRPTATDRANKKACSQSPLVKPLTRNTMGTIVFLVNGFTKGDWLQEHDGHHHQREPYQ